MARSIIMEEFSKLGKRLRNLSLVMLLLAILILTVWIVIYLTISKNEFLYLAYIGIVLFLAGILLLTRIQFVLWAGKKGPRGSYK